MVRPYNSPKGDVPPSSECFRLDNDVLPDVASYSSESTCSRTTNQSLAGSDRCHPHIISFENEFMVTEKDEDDCLGHGGHIHTRPRIVSFSTIEVNYYDFALGDNPSCSSTGPPLTICWVPKATRTFGIEAYEKMRVSKRRSEQMLRINGLSRHHILRGSDQ